MFPLSYKMRVTYLEGKRASWGQLRGRLRTLRPARILDRPRPSVRLVEPAASKVVSKNDISCIIIHWIWLQSYRNTT